MIYWSVLCLARMLSMESKIFKVKSIYFLSGRIAARHNSFFLFGLARLRFGIGVVVGIG